MSEDPAGAVSPPAPARRWFLHRTALFIGILAVLWAGWSVYSHAAARHKVDPALLAALGAHQPVNIWVELPFPPEEFHIRYLQDRGTVTGVRGRWVHLLRVRAATAWSIARLYWVKRVQGEPGPQGAAGFRRSSSGRRVGHAVLPV
jgi:hypothetical protein